MNQKWKILRVLLLHDLEHIRKSYFLHLCIFNKTELILTLFACGPLHNALLEIIRGGIWGAGGVAGFRFRIAQIY